MLLLSILYRLLRSLLGFTAMLMRRDLSKDAELLVYGRRTPCCAAKSLGCVTRPPIGCSWPLYLAWYRAAAGRESFRFLQPRS
jgi:hypothetical protein